MTPEITIAGGVVPSPLNVIADYAGKFGGTLRKYDFKRTGGPNALTADEIWDTRIIHSRVSHAETTALEEASAGWAGLWEVLPVDAHIEDADPAVESGLYDDMLKLYAGVTEVRGFKMSKASKILHVKRPHLYPILDSRLRALYSEAALVAAEEYPERGFKRMYGAAVRNDVVANKDALQSLRGDLANADPPLSALADLSDVRLLDILGWAR